MLYQLRIDEFSLLIPDIDDKVLVIQDCELAYRRLASQTKEM